MTGSWPETFQNCPRMFQSVAYVSLTIGGTRISLPGLGEEECPRLTERRKAKCIGNLLEGSAQRLSRGLTTRSGHLGGQAAINRKRQTPFAEVGTRRGGRMNRPGD